MCVLILYFAALLNLLVLTIFFIVAECFLCIWSCHLQAEVIFCFLFLIGMSFISYLIALNRMSNTLLNEWQECLSLLCTRSLKGGFPSPPDPHQHLIKCDISCGLFGLGPLLCWSMIIILLFCGETFPWINHKLGQLIFFLHLFKISSVFIYFVMYCMYHINFFSYVELFLHQWDKSHLIMMQNAFNVLLNLLC